MYTYIGIIFLLAVIWLFTTKKSSENDILEKETTDALKGIAMLMIVLHHMATNLIGTIQLIGWEYYALAFMCRVGNLGTAIFIFLSGYGNYISYCKMNKRKRRSNLRKESIQWVCSRILRILIEFIIAYIIVVGIYIICKIPMNIVNIQEGIRGLITITFPNTSTWFLKMLLLLYFLFGLSFGHFKDDSRACMAMTVVILCIITFMCGMHFESYWWDTLLCFPMGVFVAIKKETIKICLLDKNKEKLLYRGGVILFCGCFLCAGKGTPPIGNIFECLLLCPLMVFYTYRYTVKCKIYTYISKYTLEIYMVHLAVIRVCLKDSCFSNLECLFSILVSLILSVLINKVYQISVAILGIKVIKEQEV